MPFLGVPKFKSFEFLSSVEVLTYHGYLATVGFLFSRIIRRLSSSIDQYVPGMYFSYGTTNNDERREQKQNMIIVSLYASRE